MKVFLTIGAVLGITVSVYYAVIDKGSACTSDVCPLPSHVEFLPPPVCDPLVTKQCQYDAYALLFSSDPDVRCAYVATRVTISIERADRLVRLACIVDNVDGTATHYTYLHKTHAEHETFSFDLDATRFGCEFRNYGNDPDDDRLGMVELTAVHFKEGELE